MIRICAAVVMSFGLSAPAFAGKAEKCDLFGDMTQEIAEMRKEGVSEQDALAKMAELHKKRELEILQLIPYLSSFVYGLSKTHLKEDVGAAMAEQCKAT